MEGKYLTPQVCLNGHIVNENSIVGSLHNQDFCTECGDGTITACPVCSAHIGGEWYQPGSLHILPEQEYVLPRFCYNCGKPYPWTERRLEAAQSVAEEMDGITEQEREILKKSLQEIVRDTPQTEVASMRLLSRAQECNIRRSGVGNAYDQRNDKQAYQLARRPSAARLGALPAGLEGR
jgi:hypothetical protein